MGEKIYTTTDLCKLLNINQAAVMHHVHKLKLGTLLNPRMRIYTEAEYQILLNRRTTPGRVPDPDSKRQREMKKKRK